MALAGVACEQSKLLLLVRQMETPVSKTNVAVRALQVLQTSVQFPGHWHVVRPGHLSERLIQWAELQQMFCCLAASPKGHCSDVPMRNFVYIL